MDVVRWSEFPVEQLSPTIGRQLIHTEAMSFARVQLKQGALVPLHQHVHEQIVTVLEGKVRFVAGDEERVVEAGESVPLATNVPHAVEALEDALLIDVFSPVRDDWLRGEDAYLRG